VGWTGFHGAVPTDGMLDEPLQREMSPKHSACGGLLGEIWRLRTGVY